MTREELVALRALPSVQPDHVADISKKVEGDCISRQAAIGAVDVLCQEHRYRIPGKRETYSQYNEAWQDALDRAEVAIGNLPTVQPESSTDIDNALALLDGIRSAGRMEYYSDYCALHDAISQISAQPELIRCKDCDWWTKQKDSVQGCCELMQMYPAGGWYCGNARRRPE